MKGTGALLNLEALPPNLRDLSPLGPECRREAPGPLSGPGPLGTALLHSGCWVGARVASLPGPIPRPGASSVAEQENRTDHVLIKPDILTSYQQVWNWPYWPVGQVHFHQERTRCKLVV